MSNPLINIRPFNSTPIAKARPRIETNITAWVNDHPPETKETARYLASTIYRISQQEFERTFTTTVNAWNQKNITRYAAFSVEEKSNEWVTAMALEKIGLTNLPESIHTFNYPFFDRFPSYPFPNDVVFFDDASYSGTQMATNIYTLCSKLDENAKIKGEKRDPLHIHIACAYMTSGAKNLILKLPTDPEFTALSFPCIIDILPYQPIPTVFEAIQHAYPSAATQILTNLHQMYWSNESIENQGAHLRGVVWFDHKIPDAASFPSRVNLGQAVDLSGAVVHVSWSTYRPITKDPFTRFISTNDMQFYDGRQMMENASLLPPYKKKDENLIKTQFPAPEVLNPGFEAIENRMKDLYGTATKCIRIN